jgi:hypothetical protein
VSDEPQASSAEDLSRDPKTGRILPGRTLNPGGQEKWVKECRERLLAGSVDAADYLVRVIRGEEQFITVVGKDATEVTLPVQPKDRINAVKLLFEFTLTKPKQEVEVSAGTTAMSEAQRAVLARLTGLDS